MADIAAGNVSYAQVGRGDKTDSSKRRNIIDITFGNGALTYPAGGIPLVKEKLGMAVTVESLLLVDPASANGYVYKYDSANVKVRIYKEADGADALDELVAATDAPAATTLRVQVVGY